MKYLIEEYAKGYQLLVDELNGLTESELLFKPSPASWSIKEVIIHVADSEIVGIHRMKAVISEENPLLTNMDQDRWATGLNYAHLDHLQYLALFKLLRESFIPALLHLSEADWKRKGTHNTAGELTLQDLLQKYVTHVEDHIRQMKRIKACWK